MLLNSDGLNTIVIISNSMRTQLSTLRHIRDTILYTKFHIGWVFLVLGLSIAACVYALSQLV